MKKLLFCAGVLALAASCTEELDNYSVQQEEAAGITFTAVAPQEDAATKGEFQEGANGNVWYPFWSAETDEINIFATNVIANKAEKGGTKVEFDADYLMPNKNASYKATRSERSAYFTATNEQNILDFTDDVMGGDATATFFAVYPNTVTLASNAKVDWEKGFEVKLELGTALPKEQEQTNTQGKGIYELNAKYAVATGSPKADNQIAVGENVPLQFNRILSGLVFKTEGVDPYTVDEDIFGNLASIEVTMDGEYKDGKKVTTGTPQKASKLTYDAGSSVTLKIAVNGSIEEDPNFIQTSASSTITLNLNQKWNDDARGYMIIAPVSRVANKKAWNEGVKVVYTFDKIEFLAPVLETSNSWEANKFIPVPALDINDYPWLVVKGKKNGTYNDNDLTLIINEGADFDKMYDADGKTIAWEWDDAGTPAKTVNASQIKRIICNIDLTDAQLKTIGSNFTALTDITYNVETSIPAGAFAKQAKNITRLVMPKVTEINKDFSKNGNTNNKLEALTELNLASYTFPNTDINYLLFNGMDTPTTGNNKLAKLNMSAVTSMVANFYVNRTMAFENFTALQEVVLNKEGVVLSQKAFKGCKALLSVTGTVDFNKGLAAEAFYEAGSNNTYDKDDLTTSFNAINVTGEAIIPAKAFYGAKAIHNINVNGKQIVPTWIGDSAFENAAALEYMDLSKATEIGENAFKNATAYKGANSNRRVDVNPEIIEKNILGGTAVYYVYFTNATKIMGNIFEDCSALKQVEFAKTFTAECQDATEWEKAFGNAAETVDVFIKEGQKYFDLNNPNVLAFPTDVDSKGNEIAWDGEVVFKSVGYGSLAVE